MEAIDQTGGNLFKFSPYKSLIDDQYKTAESRLDSLLKYLCKSEEAVFLVHDSLGKWKNCAGSLFDEIDV